MTEQAIKPPPQIAGVVGIESGPVMVASEPTGFPVEHAIHLPCFQMFAAEKLRNVSGKDSLEHAIDVVEMHRDKINALMEDYCLWFEQKGYWPNETPWGEVKQ